MKMGKETGGEEFSLLDWNQIMLEAVSEGEEAAVLEGEEAAVPGEEEVAVVPGEEVAVVVVVEEAGDDKCIFHFQGFY